MLERKQNNKRVTLAKHVTQQNHSVLAKFRILKGLKGEKNQEFPPFGKFVNEVLIFKSSRSQMLFEIGALKNIAILELFSNKVADLLLQNTYGG